jgi:hypothetical protein
MCSSKALSSEVVTGSRADDAILKSLAGVGVAYPRHEEAKAEGQHDDIQHEMLLVARVSQLLRVFREGMAMDQNMGLRS